MNLSPVELHQYNLTCLRIEEIDSLEASRGPSTDLVQMDQAQLRAAVDIGEPLKKKPKKDEPPHYSIRLRIVVEPREGESFPYRVEVGLRGFFTVHSAKDPSDARALAAVNGTSMLYSAAKEIVLAQTLRFWSGPLMLPSVHFLDLKQAMSDSKPDKSAPAAMSEAAVPDKDAGQATRPRRRTVHQRA